MNNDTVVTRDFLSILLDFKCKNPQYHVIAPLIPYYYNKNRIWNAGGQLFWGFRRYHFENQDINCIKNREYLRCSFITADAMLVTLKNDSMISSTLPGKVQSYMISGKPIIGAINGETKYIINEAKCGLCCDAEDYKELANLIVQFCESDEKELMAINSYDYYYKNYSKDGFLSTLEEALINMEVSYVSK